MKNLTYLILIVFGLIFVGCSQNNSTNSPIRNSNQVSESRTKIDLDKTRKFSDEIARFIIENRVKDLREKMEKEFRDAVSENEMPNTLDKFYEEYGKPLKINFKEAKEGIKVKLNGETGQVAKFWYGVETTKHKMGTHFLIIEVVPFGDSFACGSFSIVNFDGEIPPHLR